MWLSGVFNEATARALEMHADKNPGFEQTSKVCKVHFERLENYVS